MSKRSNENSQLRREEVEALDEEESSGGGLYERAAPEVLAQRRIIKVKRNTTDYASKVPNFGVSDNFGGSGAAAGNPFGGFQGLSSADAAPPAANPFRGFSGLIAPAPAPSANPFGGFSGLVTAAPAPAVAAKPFGGFSGLVTAAPAPAVAVKPFGGFSGLVTAAPLATTIPSGGFNGFPTSSITSTTINPIAGGATAAATADSEYQKKIRKLNSSVSSWMDRQIVDHPLSIWKDGLKDYVRYSADITEKYGGSADVTADTDTGAPKAAFPSNKAPASFTNFSSAASATETSNAAKASSGSSSQFTSFAMPAVALSATEDKAPKVAVNWSVPGLSTEAKSSAAPFALPSFSFNTNPTAPFGSLPAATSAGFTSSFSGGFAPAAVAADTAGDEDEGEPIMEAEKVLRNDADKDDIIAECNCKLHRFDTGKGDNGKGEWIDVGKGTFRVTKCTITGKQRMLVRNSVGKIIFNAAFYKGMKVERKSPGKFSFGVVTDESGALRTFLLTVKPIDDASIFTALQAAIANI